MARLRARLQMYGLDPGQWHILFRGERALLINKKDPTFRLAGIWNGQPSAPDWQRLWVI